MRLIDAEALAEKLETLAVRYKAMGNTELAEDYLFILRVLEPAPTVDAVPVVRCRECRHHYDDIDGPCCTFGPCTDTTMFPDDFCSYGEREEQ